MTLTQEVGEEQGGDGLFICFCFLSSWDSNFYLSLNPECPLSLAAQLDNATDLLKVLRNGGAHLDFRTRDGLTAVHCATRQRNAGALTVSEGRTPVWRDSRAHAEGWAWHGS